jgi:hypothetical protein
LRKRVKGEYFLQISQSETRNAFGGHVIEDVLFFLLSYGSFGLAVSEKKIFFNSDWPIFFKSSPLKPPS